MAIAKQTNGQNSTTSSSTLSITGLVTSGANRLLGIGIIAGAVSAGARTVSTVKWNTSEAGTFIHTGGGSGNFRTEQWYLKAPGSGTHDIDIVMGGSCIYLAAHVIQWTGAHQTAPLDVSGYGTGTSSQAKKLVTTTVDGCVLMDTTLVDNSAVGESSGGGQQQTLAQTFGALAEGLGSSHVTGVAGNYDNKWNWSITDPETWGMLIAGFQPAAAAVADLIKPRPIFF